MNEDDEKLYIAVLDNYGETDPNDSGAMIGLVYPWAVRPKLVERLDQFDLYDYGPNGEEWDDDDNYMYYGATFSESYFSNYSNGYAADWQATTKARENTHNVEVNAGDLFGSSDFTDDGDTTPLLAHSNFKSTWPERFNVATGSYESYWPGWFAKDYYGENPEKWAELGIVGGPSSCAECCDGTRPNQNCWIESEDRHISNTDVYMEFDDRWAFRGNQINNNEYVQTGYPMGLKVKSMAHSYGVAYAEDIMFVTVKVRNESGYWTDEDGTYNPAMVMPDGTQLNGGKGFDYKGLFLGFYMDADVLMGDINGYSSALHTNNDDYMEFIDCATNTEIFPDGCPVVNGDKLRISMAIIGDYDGSSGPASGFSMQSDGNQGTGFGLVVVQLLDSPLATENVNLNPLVDDIDDILVGEPLKMTDWHWFDWYNRPGVVSRESGNNCCAGYSPTRPQAANKELIQYKVMAGDNTNLTDDEGIGSFIHLIQVLI